MVRVCGSHIIFPCLRRPSICPSRYLLLNNWEEFNQTSYITSPHGKDVREQHYFSVRPSSVHLSVTLFPPKKWLGKSPGSATITNRSPSQTPRGRGNRQIQSSTNRTNVRKALTLALSSPSEVIAMLKGLKNTRTK